MQQRRTYNTDIEVEPITVTLNEADNATTLIAVSDTTVNEDGTLTINEVADPAPHRLNYGEIVEAILALRYTIGAEIALNRLPDDNDEKRDYLAFVEAAKAAAKAALRLNDYAQEEVKE